MSRRLLAVAASAAVLAGGGLVWAGLRAPAPRPLARPLLAPAGLQGGFAPVIAAVRPAVVSIARPAGPGHVSPGSGPRFVDPFAQGEQRIGAGVIVDPRGYVLTSQQVAGRARDLWVTVPGSPPVVLRARRVAEDPAADLVLLRAESRAPLPAAPLGDSDRLELGDLVLAFGSPFGFSESVSAGIVSSNHRRLTIEGRIFDDLIQTDARLNPGSSGGPLVDIHGQVVGLGIGTLAMNSTFVGIGFAIASNRARALLAQVGP
jgi:serine protease Do